VGESTNDRMKTPRAPFRSRSQVIPPDVITLDPPTLIISPDQLAVWLV